MGGAGAGWIGWGVLVDPMGFKIAFPGIQGAVVAWGFETVPDVAEPHGYLQRFLMLPWYLGDLAVFDDSSSVRPSSLIDARDYPLVHVT